MPSKTRQFVKSADTSTSASSSRMEVDKLLRRYGASAISTSENIERREIVVTFVVPDSRKEDAPKVPIRLPVSVHAVYDALYGRPRMYDYEAGRWVFNAKGYEQKKLEQAERVAWRNLVLWLDAALSAASVGLQTITEAFFAHAVVTDGGVRMIELVDQAQNALGPGVQRLLTAPAETEG